ncbi:MAG: hypothetical protein K2X57_30210 [Xanthobacteraceae bacterium]|nr:hypothetical protein [Xanthobacteraceae bacterium]
MNWAWASSLDQIWRSPTFPMWLTLAAAGFFGIIVLITLLRAEKSVANGALTVITLLAIAVAVAATIRGFGPGDQVESAGSRSVQPVRASLPQLSCIDDLAGDAVLNACEKTLFGSAESSAAAVAYAASLITQLTGAGEAVVGGKSPSSEFLALRRAVERDRYGLMAYVLMARDHCTPQACPAFRMLADRRQVASNMDDRVYENMITRYASSWNSPMPAQAGAAAGLVASLPTSMPTGKPTNAEFPTAASTPPISIMTAEPPLGAAAPKPPPAAGAAPAPRAASVAAPAAAKKPAAPKRAPAAAPVQIAPAAQAPEPAAASE